jgi:hypothetical protein
MVVLSHGPLLPGGSPAPLTRSLVDTLGLPIAHRVEPAGVPDRQPGAR